MIRDDTTVRPVEATTQDLMVVHTKGYLDSLKVSRVTFPQPTASKISALKRRQCLNNVSPI